MGMAVTAAHAIFLVTLLVGGAGLGSALLRSHDEIADARRSDARLRDAEVHTAMTVTDAAWDGPSQTATFTLDNEGSEVLDVRALDFVVDGAWATDELQPGWTVAGASSNWWAPRTTLVVELGPLDAEPTSLVVVAENGARTAWRS